MIPSDQFVRFYNEVFKKLDQLGGLEAYFLEISRHQEMHCLKEFKDRGFQGILDYCNKIAREENCDAYRTFDGECIAGGMRRCPSLSKVLDNDAEPFPRYCDHCAGWVNPLYQKAGFYIVRDHIDNAQPVCQHWIYKDRDKAAAKYRELRAAGAKLLFINFDPNEK